MARVGAPSGVVSAWLAYTRSGTLPYGGGWADQPLRLLIQMDALTLVQQTARYKAQTGFDWSKLTPLQQDLIRWLEDDDDE